MNEVIDIRTVDGNIVSVEAEIYGAWAVHLSPDRWTHGRGKPRRAITITHVPTGCAAYHHALGGISWRDARIVAKRLNTAYPVLPFDVLDASQGKVELSKASAKTMAKLGEFIVDAAIEANQKNRRRRTA